jgi:hypothetical protein
MLLAAAPGRQREHRFGRARVAASGGWSAPTQRQCNEGHLAGENVIEAVPADPRGRRAIRPSFSVTRACKRLGRTGSNGPRAVESVAQHKPGGPL